MRKSMITAEFQEDVATVWHVVTNNRDTVWRSDLQSVRILSDDKFVEKNNSGNETIFIITEKIEYKKYAFTMGNQNMTGKWVGIFTSLENGGTKVVFTEGIQLKNSVLQALSYLFINLKKMQEIYIRDLKEKLKDDKKAA